MKTTINVMRSLEHCLRFNNRTVRQIADELNSKKLSFKKIYDRNIIGEFYGTIVAETESEVFNFPISQKLTYSIITDSDLENCIGKYFN